MPELIDRISLIDKLDQWQKIALDAKDFTSFYALVYFKAMLQEAPTIEAEPVRHGRWITRDRKSAKCSCCGWRQRARTYYLPNNIHEFSKCYRFCTACGTKMDGGADNG